LEHTDKDGEPLLFVNDIETLTGWKNATLRHYSTAGKRARTEGRASKDYGKLILRYRVAVEGRGIDSKQAKALQSELRFMPAPVTKVRRTLKKANGDPLTVWSPLWRRDQILAWLKARGIHDAA
jgi:hypothetical protein